MAKFNPFFKEQGSLAERLAAHEFALIAEAGGKPVPHKALSEIAGVPIMEAPSSFPFKRGKKGITFTWKHLLTAPDLELLYASLAGEFKSVQKHPILSDAVRSLIFGEGGKPRSHLSLIRNFAEEGFPTITKEVATTIMGKPINMPVKGIVATSTKGGKKFFAADIINILQNRDDVTDALTDLANEIRGKNGQPSYLTQRTTREVLFEKMKPVLDDLDRPTGKKVPVKVLNPYAGIGYPMTVPKGTHSFVQEIHNAVDPNTTEGLKLRKKIKKMVADERAYISKVLAPDVQTIGTAHPQRVDSKWALEAEGMWQQVERKMNQLYDDTYRILNIKTTVPPVIKGVHPKTKRPIVVTVDQKQFFANAFDEKKPIGKGNEKTKRATWLQKQKEKGRETLKRELEVALKTDPPSTQKQSWEKVPDRGGPWGAAKQAPAGKKGFEVTRNAIGKDFSAFNATLKNQTSSITGKPLTIEEAYQLDVKGYRKEVEKLIAEGNHNMNYKGRIIDLRQRPELYGKGRVGVGVTEAQRYKGYENLWRQWYRENPAKVRELAQKTAGKVITDRFATTRVNQANVHNTLLREIRFKKPELIDKWLGSKKGKKLLATLHPDLLASEPYDSRKYIRTMEDFEKASTSWKGNRPVTLGESGFDFATATPEELQLLKQDPAITARTGQKYVAEPIPISKADYNRFSRSVPFDEANTPEIIERMQKGRHDPFGRKLEFDTLYERNDKIPFDEKKLIQPTTKVKTKPPPPTSSHQLARFLGGGLGFGVNHPIWKKHGIDPEKISNKLKSGKKLTKTEKSKLLLIQEEINKTQPLGSGGTKRKYFAPDPRGMKARNKLQGMPLIPNLGRGKGFTKGRGLKLKGGKVGLAQMIGTGLYGMIQKGT